MQYVTLYFSSTQPNSSAPHKKVGGRVGLLGTGEAVGMSISSAIPSTAELTMGRPEHWFNSSTQRPLHSAQVSPRLPIVLRGLRYDVRKTTQGGISVGCGMNGLFCARSQAQTKLIYIALTCSHFQRNRWQAPRSRTNIRRSSRRLPGSK